MADYTFPTDLYPSIRAAIGLEADAVSVPDTLIELPVYKGEAERFIMRNLTAEQYEDPTQAAEANYAATLFIASLIVPSMRVVLSERIEGGNLTYANINLANIAADLRARAEARLADIQLAHPVDVPAVKSINPNFFGVAHRANDRSLW